VRTLLDARLADEVADRVRQSHAGAIRELQQLPLVGALCIQGVRLVNTVETEISHRLGRAPLMVWVSPPVAIPTPLTSGLIVQYRGRHGNAGTGPPIDATRVIVLAAFNWGADITVDVVVF
jgi:hypothetical protein